MGALPMLRRANGWMYVIVALIAIGVFAQLAANPISVIVPLVIFGIIFYLFKFPPRWLLRWVQQPPASMKRKYAKQRDAKVTKVKNGKKQSKHPKRRSNVTLKVIDGKKKDWPPRRKTQ